MFSGKSSLECLGDDGAYNTGTGTATWFLLMAAV